MSISGRLLQTIVSRANRDLSSLSSTARSTVLTLITFPLLFHVCSLRFFITAQRFILPDLTLSSTNKLNSFANKAPQSSINYRIQVKTNLVILGKRTKFKTSLNCAYRNNSRITYSKLKSLRTYTLLCSYTSLCAHCDCNVI